MYVKVRSTETLATVYANSGTTEEAITQPLTSDSLGRITGWLPRGAYKVEITIPGKTPYTEYLDVQPGEAGSVDAGAIAKEAVTLEKIASSASNAAAGTPSLRSLGTTSTTATAGNDSRLTNERTPSAGSVSTTKVVDEAITEAKLQAGAVSLAKMSTAAKNNFVTTVGNTGAPKIARGVISTEVIQPGGQFQGQANGTIFHGLGVSPTSIQMTPNVGANYSVMFNFRIYEVNSSYFGWQVFSTQMPSERVGISCYWVAFT